MSNSRASSQLVNQERESDYMFDHVADHSLAIEEERSTTEQDKYSESESAASEQQRHNANETQTEQEETDDDGSDAIFKVVATPETSVPVEETVPNQNMTVEVEDVFQVNPPLQQNHVPHDFQHNKGVFPLWTRLTARMHRGITRFVVTLGVHAARHPKSYVAAILLLSFSLVGIGFFTNFNINVEETEIYAPFDSIPQDHFAWRNDESGFLESTRVTTLVVHADGANVLGWEPMERVFTALDTVRKIPGYHDICEGGDFLDERTGERTCRIISATRYWYHDTELFYNETHTDAELIATLSQLEYPGGVPADHEYVMGKLERIDNGYGNGTVTYVPAYFVYILLSNKEETEEFENLIIEQLSDLQAAWEKEDDNLLRLSYFAERSFSDEFTRAIEEDMFLVPMIFIMMSGFTCLVFFQSDRVQSRSGLGVGSVTTIGMSLMSYVPTVCRLVLVPISRSRLICSNIYFVVFVCALDHSSVVSGCFLFVVRTTGVTF